MKAATPPRRWASAMTCWQIVVLPDDSGPKISVIRPRGMPPTPRARSSAIEPVGITSIAWMAAEPSFMIEPVPNCFSIARIAADTALPRSAWARSSALSLPLRSSAARSPVIAMGSSRSCRMVLDRQVALPGETSGRSTLVGALFLFADRLFLARLPDELRLLRAAAPTATSASADRSGPWASSSVPSWVDLEKPSMCLRAGLQASD